MTSFKRRIEALEAALKDKMAERRSHDPFVQLIPWSIIGDKYQVNYYPEGMYRPPEKSGLISFSDACAMLADWPVELCCKISMGSCLEWLFVFYQFGEGCSVYTQEQLDRFMIKDMDNNPQLSFLLTTEEGKGLAEIMLRLPQSYMVRLDDLVCAIGGRANDRCR